MMGKGQFKDNGQYLEELVWIVRRFLGLYKNMYLLTDEKGRLLFRKGQVTFGVDVEFSLEHALTEQEQMEYQKEAKKLWKEMEQLKERGVKLCWSRNMIPLEYLFQIFSLDIAERFLVYLALAPLLEKSLERAYGLFQDDYNKTAMGLDLAVRIFTSDRKKQYEIKQRFYSKDSPLRYFLEGESGEALKLSPRIFRFVMNFEEEDPYLSEETRLEFPAGGNNAWKAGEEKTLLVQAIGAAKEPEGPKLFYIHGPKGVGRKTLFRQTAAGAGFPILWVDVSRLLKKPEQLFEKLKALDRELRIRMAVPCFLHFEEVQPEEKDDAKELKGKEEIRVLLLTKTAARHRLMGCISTREWKEGWEELELYKLTRMDFSIAAPDTERQIGLWREMLGDLSEHISPEELGNRFFLTPGQMTEALSEAWAQALRKGLPYPGQEELEAACRRRLTVRLEGQAMRVESPYLWEDLILPNPQKRTLRQACDQIQYRHQVYGRWGFETKTPYGQGVSMLFYGPPGTGKTMGAQVLANELRMELYKVNLASVMSKYIGETEKNLEKIFDGVKDTRNILLFDEADALFGKRTEVKDSHDKYANAETAYLLQKMEEYEGIVILATNYMQNFDEAFKRRLKFMIEFPFPDVKCRRQIWEHVFPKELPLGDLDYDYLAKRFELSGSSIKNIAVAASFLAAPEVRPVELADILTALRREMAKAGKSMTPESFGEYYDLLDTTNFF